MDKWEQLLGLTIDRDHVERLRAMEDEVNRQRAGNTVLRRELDEALVEVERLRAEVRVLHDSLAEAAQYNYDLRDKLKFMTLYRDNALALYRSANVRAWIAGDHSTHPDELK